MEDEIDLRQYVEVLIKHRWLIIMGATIAALAAFVVSFLLLEPSYEATASILIAQTRSQITLDPRFQTVDADDTVSNYYAAMNAGAHRESLAALVKSGTIATQVAERLKEELEPGEQNPVRLLGMVDGTLMKPKSDLIEITVRSSDPAKAARIANVWAEIYEQYINEVYSKWPEPYTSVQKQVITARATYEQAEEALAAFISESQTDVLQRRITETLQLVDELQTNKQAVFAELAQAERSTLRQYYDTSRELGQLLEDARAFQLQIQQSEAPAAATNELALMLLKAEAFASSKTLPGNLQLQFDLRGNENPGASGQIAELEALIEVVEGRLSGLETAIAEQSLVLLSSGSWDSLKGLPASGGQQGTAAYAATARSFDEAIDRLQAEVQQLRARLAQEEGRQQEWARARDLAWEVYSTLQVKLAEQGIAMEMMNVEVRFVSPAVEPITPADPNTLLNVALAAGVGLMMGVGAAFALHYLNPEYDSSAVIGVLLK